MRGIIFRPCRRGYCDSGLSDVFSNRTGASPAHGGSQYGPCDYCDFVLFHGLILYTVTTTWQEVKRLVYLSIPWERKADDEC